MKQNVLRNKRPVAAFQEFAFRDLDTAEVDAAGDVVPGMGDIYTFRLRALDELEWFSMREFGDRLVRRYVIGDFVDDVGDHHAKPEAWMIDDEAGNTQTVPVSEESIRYLAKIERMQGVKRDVFDDDPLEEAYGLKELAFLALTVPSVWNQLRLAVRKVEAEGITKKKPQAQSGTQPLPGSAAEPVT